MVIQDDTGLDFHVHRFCLLGSPMGPLMVNRYSPLERLAKVEKVLEKMLMVNVYDVKDPFAGPLGPFVSRKEQPQDLKKAVKLIGDRPSVDKEDRPSSSSKAGSATSIAVMTNGKNAVAPIDYEFKSKNRIEDAHNMYWQNGSVVAFVLKWSAQESPIDRLKKSNAKLVGKKKS